MKENTILASRFQDFVMTNLTRPLKVTHITLLSLWRKKGWHETRRESSTTKNIVSRQPQPPPDPQHPPPGGFFFEGLYPEDEEDPVKGLY